MIVHQVLYIGPIKQNKRRETLIENKIKKILYMSTDSVLGYEKNNISFNDNGNYKPFGIYGKSKKDFEDYLILKGKENGRAGTIIRGFLFFDKSFTKVVLQNYYIANFNLLLEMVKILET